MKLEKERIALKAIRHNVGQALTNKEMPKATRRWLLEIGKIAKMGLEE